MVSLPRGLLLLTIALAGAVGCVAAPDEGEDVGASEGAQRAGSSSSGSSASTERTLAERISDGRCNQCHAKDKKLVGPSYQAIADLYRKSNRDSTVARLTKKVTRGGYGSWGVVPMPENPYVTTAEAQWLVEYILDLPAPIVHAGTD